MMGLHKKKLLLSGIITIVGIVTLCTTLTFAWIDSRRELTQISLQAGDSVIMVDNLMYAKTDVDNANISTPATPSRYHYSSNDTLSSDAVKTTDSQGHITVNYGNMLNDFDLLSAYKNDYAIDENAFPSFFVEVRYIKENFVGYASAGIKSLPEMSSLPTEDSTLSNPVDLTSQYMFEYRYAEYINTTAGSYESSTQMIGLASNDGTILGNKSFSPITSSLDTTLNFRNTYPSSSGGETRTEPQCYVTSFKGKKNGVTLFSRSVLIQVRLNAFKFVTYIRNNPRSIANGYSFRCNLQFIVQASNTPFI
jgi:hypothetical protein